MNISTRIALSVNTKIILEPLRSKDMVKNIFIINKIFYPKVFGISSYVLFSVNSIICLFVLSFLPFLKIHSRFTIDLLRQIVKLGERSFQTKRAKGKENQKSMVQSWFYNQHLIANIWGEVSALDEIGAWLCLGISQVHWEFPLWHSGLKTQHCPCSGWGSLRKYRFDHRPIAVDWGFSVAAAMALVTDVTWILSLAWNIHMRQVQPKKKKKNSSW